MKSSTELGEELDQREKEKKELMEIVAGLEQDILSHRHTIDKERVVIREKEMTLVKAKCNLRTLDGEIKVLTRAFWSAKNGGL